MDEEFEQERRQQQQVGQADLAQAGGDARAPPGAGRARGGLSASPTSPPPSTPPASWSAVASAPPT
ncbi:hypothetical protein, partial [Streptomyces albidoflavus]|uniref:hypothetical protein n=1 Tax=Streptomyces albidoflavus TaxID=1886 RepID=UPI003F4D0A1D